MPDPDPTSTPPAIARVVAAARAASLEIDVRRHPAGARTADDAARAIGCDVAQIVKSLVFVADGAPVMALVAGSNRLDATLLAAACAATQVRRADADEVRDATGYAIGGVPPFGHASELRVLVDRDLVAFETVYAAAGLPDATFGITPADLLRASGGTVADVAERPAGGVSA
ncbi:MAG: YbaK/EbsC family protein [Chloroflexota bacterium]